MSTAYRPGTWAQKYKQLPRRERDQVNELTNDIFARQTGVHRKLDPKRDRALYDQWLANRDEVMAGSHGAKHSFLSKAAKMVSSIGDFAGATADTVQRTVQRMTTDTPWMDIARAEHAKKVIEIPGAKHSKEIMEYIRSCPDLYATKNKAIYTEREGEEGVKWCSAFVNWCMKKAGYPGTDSARALSWTSYGKALKEPQAGCILVTKGNKYRHVAFVDEVNGELKMLGGNQNQAAGGGDYNQISIRPINYGMVVAWRWPS